ncbi:Jag N-terminal domain-containing protein [Jeotgalibaca sp. MA1X17-3]|nr:Jag N-terminal domain-containing protein [Jeotgalibaca sp. MA1X17-3]UJF16630.1 Jag N-terminal domain-containing protein [Jeotgalibaca sp. MA1X17-3]
MTVEKAVSKGLVQLGLDSQDVDIEIISEGKKASLVLVQEKQSWN